LYCERWPAREFVGGDGTLPAPIKFPLSQLKRE
jgi:hypothetical protein